jgi:hypothetical protein
MAAEDDEDQSQDVTCDYAPDIESFRALSASKKSSAHAPLDAVRTHVSRAVCGRIHTYDTGAEYHAH